MIGDVAGQCALHFRPRAFFGGFEGLSVGVRADDEEQPGHLQAMDGWRGEAAAAESLVQAGLLHVEIVHMFRALCSESNQMCMKCKRKRDAHGVGNAPRSQLLA